MDRRLIIYSALFILLIGFVIYVDASAPRPVNWTPTYSVRDKIPFGLYVLDNESKRIFEGQEVKKFSETPYEFFDSNYNYETDQYTIAGTLIKIEENSTIDRESVNELFVFANRGNTVFLSMKSFPQSLLDTLGIAVKNEFYIKDSIGFKVDKPGSAKHFFAEGISFTSFDSLPHDSARVLGHQYIDKNVVPNLVKVQYGNGSFILHTQPAVFTNFHLLKGNHYKYAEDVLNIIPEGDIYWNAQGMSGVGESSSMLRYIFSQPALKWAYYLSLIALFVFMFFNAKRKQRIIPEIEPVRNTTVDFAKTIGNLYFQEGNHHTIIEKKIIHFLEKVRREYMIDTYSLDDGFIEKLHSKTGAAREDIEQAVQLIKKHRHQFESTDTDVIELNKAIEKLRL